MCLGFNPFIVNLKMFLCLNRQISQEDKNWEQNIQELQKKVRFQAWQTTDKLFAWRCNVSAAGTST